MSGYMAGEDILGIYYSIFIVNFISLFCQYKIFNNIYYPKLMKYYRLVSLSTICITAYSAS